MRRAQSERAGVKTSGRPADGKLEPGNKRINDVTGPAPQQDSRKKGNLLLVSPLAGKEAKKNTAGKRGRGDDERKGVNRKKGKGTSREHGQIKGTFPRPRSRQSGTHEFVN